MFVPVIDKDQKPLMSTKPSRARRWIKLGKATPFFNKGVFCVRLNVEPSDSQLDDIVVGVDPGSKKEAFTVKSEHHTYLNVQADAVTHVSKRIKSRREQRRGRRFRKRPYRKNRINRTQGSIPPSTRANCIVKGHDVPDNTDIVHIVPYQLHRRQLHRLQPSKGGKRHRYGGTISMGLKRGRWVQHTQHGLCFVGGFQKHRLSLHSLATGKRITLSAKLEDLTMLCFSGWRTRSAVASPP